MIIRPMTPEQFIEKARQAAVLSDKARLAAETAKEHMQSRLETGWEHHEDRARELAALALGYLEDACRHLQELTTSKIKY